MANADVVGHVDNGSSSERLKRVCHGGSGAPGEVSVNYGSGSVSFNGSGTPAMPHLDFTGQDLDVIYPSILASDDELLDDLAHDDHDNVYQHGLRIADETRSQMHEHGRRRHFTDLD